MNWVLFQAIQQIRVGVIGERILTGANRGRRCRNWCWGFAARLAEAFLNSAVKLSTAALKLAMNIVSVCGVGVLNCRVLSGPIFGMMQIEEGENLVPKPGLSYFAPQFLLKLARERW